MLKQLKRLAIAGVIICASGCASPRVVSVIDSQEDVVRLVKPVRAFVAKQDEDGCWVDAGWATLPAGSYVGQMPDGP